MGFITSTKIDGLIKSLDKATEQGRRTVSVRLNTPKTDAEFSDVIPYWSEAIDEIESRGWVLAEWSVSADSKGRPQAFPLFRRAH